MPRRNYYGLILAGGRGTRFWPRSRRTRAKQVLNVFGDRSLIQQTVDRLRAGPASRANLDSHQRPSARRDRSAAAGSSASARSWPSPRSATRRRAIGLAAHILHRSIRTRSWASFRPITSCKPRGSGGCSRPRLSAAERGQHRGAGNPAALARDRLRLYRISARERSRAVCEPVPVQRFREKPDEAAARRFLEAGNFYWNAGMFFWRGRVPGRLAPASAEDRHTAGGLPPFSSRRVSRALAEAFPQSENISIDYAVLERAANVVGMPAAGDIGWNDVGSWNAVYELHRADATATRCAPRPCYRGEHRQLRRRRGQAGSAAGREGPDRRRYARRAADRRPHARPGSRGHRQSVWSRPSGTTCCNSLPPRARSS